MKDQLEQLLPRRARDGTVPLQILASRAAGAPADPAIDDMTYPV